MSERKLENVVVSKSKGSAAPTAKKVADTGKSVMEWTALKGTLNNSIIDLNCEIAHDSKYTYIRYDNSRALYESDNHNPIVSTTKGQYYDKITGITLTVTAYEYRYSKSGKKSKTYSG